MAKKSKVILMLFCDFCGLSQNQCGALVRGRDEVHICSECVSVCVDLLAEHQARQVTPPTDADPGKG